MKKQHIVWRRRALGASGSVVEVRTMRNRFSVLSTFLLKWWMATHKSPPAYWIAQQIFILHFVKWGCLFIIWWSFQFHGDKAATTQHAPPDCFGRFLLLRHECLGLSLLLWCVWWHRKQRDHKSNPGCLESRQARRTLLKMTPPWISVSKSITGHALEVKHNDARGPVVLSEKMFSFTFESGPPVSKASIPPIVLIQDGRGLSTPKVQVPPKSNPISPLRGCPGLRPSMCFVHFAIKPKKKNKTQRNDTSKNHQKIIIWTKFLKKRTMGGGIQASGTPFLHENCVAGRRQGAVWGPQYRSHCFLTLNDR